MRRQWLTSHVRDGAPAERAAALGRAAHERLLAAGDRLATLSPRLAQAAWRRAAAAWTVLGPEGFEGWVTRGERLAVGSPAHREVGGAFFAVDPERLGARADATLAAWGALGARLATRSPRLATVFLTRSGPLLESGAEVVRLAAWVAAAEALHDETAPASVRTAEALLASMPGIIEAVPPAVVLRWGRLARALAARPADLLGAPPAALAAWPVDEAAALLDLLLVVADRAVPEARTLHAILPKALGGLEPAERGAVLGVLGSIGGAAAARLADVAPVLGPLLRATPAPTRMEALALVGEVATRAPRAALAMLGVLPRLYEVAPPARVRRWVAAGLEVAADDGPVADAYFGLVSRTSERVLRHASTAATLEETRGVWAKLVHMLSGVRAVPRPVESCVLRPPLEDVPEHGGIALPAVVAALPTWEENGRLFRLVAATVAGRRTYGTYAAPARLREALHGAESPDLLEPLFLVAEGIRIHHRVTADYPGLAAEAATLLGRALARWSVLLDPPPVVILDALLACAIVPGAPVPPWLTGEVAALVRRLTAPLARPEASVDDALGVARTLAAAVTLGSAMADAELAEVTTLLGAERAMGAEAPEEDASPLDGPGGDTPAIDLGGAPADRPRGGSPLSREEILALLAAGATIEQATGAVEGAEFSITELAGKLPPAVLEALRRAAETGGGRAAPPRPARAAAQAGVFFYDEWDHVIDDYRSRWCRLEEIRLPGDEGEFFARTLRDYGTLIPEVRRQFQRIPPATYRPVRGLEDGEDFDLNAVIEARVEQRARRAPSTRLYRARVREQRDVATCFLVDMSASTDEPVATPDGEPRRIIDITKAAVVVMAEALEALGDAYAIYGFSGQGREQVEVYPVKRFGERLGVEVKARIGGMEPRRSTRMGAALRHVGERMAHVGARAKHLILLSDGFPQDLDYGEDRRSHTYGIRDTAAALREVTAAGITPLCITVDRAGHDYLREMCDPRRYVVLDEVAALPHELPKIYQRLVPS